MIIDFTNINGGGGGGYVLPIASQSTLGGVKVGQNLTIDSGGTLNAVGGEQDYQIVSAITDYTAGKMYGVVDESEYSAFFEDSTLFCGNFQTDFYGKIEDTESDSSFNPWVQGRGIYIDTYIDRDASTGINTLTVKYVNDTIINETLSEGESTFSLPSSGNFSGATLIVTSNETEYNVTYSGSGLYECGFYIHKNVWEYNQNIAIAVATTSGNEPRFSGISYTNGTTANPLTVIENSRYVNVWTGSDDMHKQLAVRKMQGYTSIPSEGSSNGDVLSLNGQLWKYKSTSGTSCVINDFKGYNEYGDIVINYYSLPQNQVLFHFTTNFGFERYVSYNNGVFTLWEDSGMTTSAETITEGSDIDLWWSNVQGTSIPGLMRMTSMQNQNGNINLSVSIVGDWNLKSSGHWEPGDWEDQVNSAPLYKVNRVKSSPYATVEGDGINPKMLTTVGDVYNNTFGIFQTMENTGMIVPDNSGYTVDLSYVNESFTGTVCNGYNRITSGADTIEISFGLEITPNGLKSVCVDTDNMILLWEITGVTYGTYTVGAGQSYEAVITYSYDNIYSIHFTNGLTFTTDMSYGGILLPLWKQDGKLYGAKQRQPIATTGHTGMVKVGDYLNIDASGTLSVNASSITNGVSFWKGTQAEYDALSGTTGYDSSTLYIITDTPNAV